MMMELVSQSTLLLVALGVAVLVIAAAFLAKALAPPFQERPLMNQTELRLFKMLRAELPNGWSIMTQVSYGAFLRNKSFKHYMRVNSKRADFVILDPDLKLAMVVEYQGKGHFGTTRNSRAQAEKSDGVKRQALREAGIPLSEVPAKFDRDGVARMIQTLAVQDDNGPQRKGYGR